MTETDVWHFLPDNGVPLYHSWIIDALLVPYRGWTLTRMRILGEVEQVGDCVTGREVRPLWQADCSAVFRTVMLFFVDIARQKLAERDISQLDRSFMDGLADAVKRVDPDPHKRLTIYDMDQSSRSARWSPWPFEDDYGLKSIVCCPPSLGRERDEYAHPQIAKDLQMFIDKYPTERSIFALDLEQRFLALEPR